MQTSRRSLSFRAAGLAACALMLAAGCPGSVLAQDGTPAAAAPPATAKLEPAAVERWADGLFGQWVSDHRVSALAVTVTQDDQVVLTKGYGYADWATRAPVDAETSQFRIASLTKTFVATAIAQLLEQGEIEALTDPANKYLTRFQLPKNNGEDVTLWDLLTHRPGFAYNPPNDPNLPATLPVAGALITAKIPPYARPRDTISVYSNFGVGVLGFVIEDVTGQTLPDYFQAHLFGPLGMTHSALATAREAAPEMVRQYAFVPGGAPVQLPYPISSTLTPAAGAVVSTAADMSKWLIAHIAEGEGAGPKLLAPTTFRLMHTRHNGNHPRQSGFGMNFFVYDYNGETVLEHYGSLQFRSLELMLMGSKIGIFVTMGGGGQPRPDEETVPTPPLDPIPGPVLPAISHSGARAAILEHFLGTLPVDESVKVNVAPYLGEYLNIARDGGSQPPQPVVVADSGDGGLTINGVGPYRPSGPDLFTLVGALPLDTGFGFANRYAFDRRPDGSVLMFTHVNAGAYEKRPPASP